MPNGGLDRLTDRERRVLRLLASGHSVKSAANEEAISENATNELLRSARRKLGTGSSREAARLLAEHEDDPQKIRHEKSVVPRLLPGAPTAARISRGTIAMIATALTAVAALVLAVQAGNRVPIGPAKVIRTTPANRATVAPGPFTLSVTFDRPMAAQSYSFVRTDEGAFPECAGPPRLSQDGRTYSLDCTAKPGKYVVYFNQPPYTAFRDAQTGTAAATARLEFTVRP